MWNYKFFALVCGIITSKIFEKYELLGIPDELRVKKSKDIQMIWLVRSFVMTQSQ
jgi:hypothetical protein